MRDNKALLAINRDNELRLIYDKYCNDEYNTHEYRIICEYIKEKYDRDYKTQGVKP